jgi:hypothetical protein
MLLATCLRHQNHGKFNGSIEEQLAILDRAVRNGAHAIDVEIETAEGHHSLVTPIEWKLVTVVFPRR